MHISWRIPYLAYQPGESWPGDICCSRATASGGDGEPVSEYAGGGVSTYVCACVCTQIIVCVCVHASMHQCVHL